MNPRRGEKVLNTTPGSAPGKSIAGSHGPPSGLADDAGRERLIVNAVEPHAELRRQAAERVRVLHVGGDVQQVVDGVAVAIQIDLASGGRQRAVVVDAVREADARESAHVRQRRRVRVAPVAAELAARDRRQASAGHEVVRVERQTVHRPDEHLLIRRPAVQTGRDDDRRLNVDQFGRVDVEHEVVADVRALQIDQQTIAHDPLVAELVGRVRTGVPPVLAERRWHRALRRGRLDRVEVRGAARVALLLREVVEERQLVALKSCTSPFRLVVCSSVEVGVQAAVDVVDRRA